jgi:hypothetical protein
MRGRSLAVAALLVLAGCSHATLPYTPVQQPPGARISAAYAVIGDRLRVELDTDRHRLEQAWIMKPDGTSVAPTAVDAAPVVQSPPPSLSVGAGGGGTVGAHGGFGGGGLSVGIPVGSGRSHVSGNTIVWFPLASAGPAPWAVYVKLAGIVPSTIMVGGPIP